MQRDARSILRLEDRAQPPPSSSGPCPPWCLSSARGCGAESGRPGRARIAGIVSLDGDHDGRTLYGTEVLGGLSRLGDLLNALKAAEGRTPRVVLAEPRPSRALIEQVIAAAAPSGAEVVGVRQLGRIGLAPAPAGRRPARPPAPVAGRRSRGQAGERQARAGDGRGRHHRVGADAPGHGARARPCDPVRRLGVQPLRHRPGASGEAALQRSGVLCWATCAT